MKTGARKGYLLWVSPLTLPIMQGKCSTCLSMCVNRYLWNEIKFIPWISCFWSHTRCVWGEHQSHCRTITANQPHFTRQNDTAITAWILARWGLLQISSQTTECPHCYSSIPELQVLHVYIYKTFLQIHLPSYIHVWWSILDLFPLLTLPSSFHSKLYAWIFPSHKQQVVHYSNHIFSQFIFYIFLALYSLYNVSKTFTHLQIKVFNYTNSWQNELLRWRATLVITCITFKWDWQVPIFRIEVDYLWSTKAYLGVVGGCICVWTVYIYIYACVIWK